MCLNVHFLTLICNILHLCNFCSLFLCTLLLVYTFIKLSHICALCYFSFLVTFRCCQHWNFPHCGKNKALSYYYLILFYLIYLINNNRLSVVSTSHEKKCLNQTHVCFMPASSLVLLYVQVFKQGIFKLLFSL